MSELIPVTLTGEGLEDMFLGYYAGFDHGSHQGPFVARPGRVWFAEGFRLGFAAARMIENLYCGMPFNEAWVAAWNFAAVYMREQRSMIASCN